MGLKGLLWLAMLLPLAQAAAAWHSASHVLAEAGGRVGDAHGPADKLCDLCLAAAAVSGGALPSTPQSPELQAMGHAAPLALPLGVIVALQAAPYQSRAPPVSPR